MAWRGYSRLRVRRLFGPSWMLQITLDETAQSWRAQPGWRKAAATPLGSTRGAGLGALEEVHAHLAGRGQARGRLVKRLELVGVGKRDPIAQGQGANVEPA